MATYNVNRGVTDAYYRYKMPRLVAKVEGKGNGIKTVIVNMVDVAKALGRPPTYPTKYFGCELGAQTQFDFKNERFVVNGSHDADRLQELLDGFIRKFVLCPECDNPETVLHVQSKRGQVSQSCKACGHSCTLDHRHKLLTFVLKNPPDQKPAAQGSSLTEGKRGKRGSKKSSPPKEDSPSPPTEKNGESRGHKDDDDDDGDWCVDVSEEAVRARMQALGEGIVKGLNLVDVAETSERNRLDNFYTFIRSKLEGDQLDPRKVCAEADALGIKPKAPLVLAELLLLDQADGKGAAGVLQQIKKYAKLFACFTQGCPRAQRYLLGGIEQLVASNKDTLMPKVPHILKVFYDLDILDEEVILDWGKKPSKKFVSRDVSAEIRGKAAPFLKWLEEAEYEDEDDTE